MYCIGIPVLNRIDLLAEAIRTLHVPAPVIVVNNNPRLRNEVDALGVEALHQSRNIGYSGSWNLLAKTAFERGFRYLLITANDVRHSPGVIESAIRFADSAQEHVLWKLSHLNSCLINRRSAEQVGEMDENLYPAYFEDDDWLYRVKVSGNTAVDVPLTGPIEHLGSQTTKSDERYMRASQETFVWNREYYRKKWGGWPGLERHTSPWNDRRLDHRFWRPTDNSKRDWDHFP